MKLPGRIREVLIVVTLSSSVGCPTRTIPGFPGDGGASGGGAGTGGASGSVGTGGRLGTGGSVSGAAGEGGALSTGGMSAGGSAGGGGAAVGGSLGSGGQGAKGGGGLGGTSAGGVGGGPAVGGAAGGSSTGTALGGSCTADSVCTSGHCVSGVCCDQACTGPCAQCTAIGHCQMPTDDASCGTIKCPPDTQCRDYATSISVNRCKSVGACKTSADCSYQDAPVAKLCDYYQGMTAFAEFCDGAGACVGPTVSCGGDGQCPLYDMMCCSSGPGYSCGAATSGCGSGNYGPYYCDETADCDLGLVCCLSSTPGGIASGCTNGCGGTIGQYLQLCNPSASPSECVTGACLPVRSTDPPAPPGFHTCQ